MSYCRKRVLVTGGLGFIGSNLALRLVNLGAEVTLVDSSVGCCGSNAHNIAPARNSLRIIPLDLSRAAEFRHEIQHSDLIFNLAGEISHIHSMRFPERDLQLNTVAQLRFLQECVRQAPGIRIVYTSTRQIYGTPRYLPVNEEHPIEPVDFNGIHKFAASMYHLTLGNAGLLDPVVLRLTNVYGPRMALNIPCQGFLSTFLRRALTGQPIEVFGEGTQLRDPVYVEDVVDALLLAGSVKAPASRTYNAGGPEALELRHLAGIVSRARGLSVPVVYRPFPGENKKIDIGSYCTDWSRIQRELGWRPAVGFETGIALTVDFYSSELHHYLDISEEQPSCSLEQSRMEQTQMEILEARESGRVAGSRLSL